MLKMEKTIKLKGILNVGDVRVKEMVSETTHEGISTIYTYMYDNALYIAHRTEMRKDEQEFQKRVIEVEDFIVEENEKEDR